jgi:hypothetical protein
MNEAVAGIVAGQLRPLDAGEINGRLFLNNAGRSGRVRHPQGIVPRDLRVNSSDASTAH